MALSLCFLCLFAAIFPVESVKSVAKKILFCAICVCKNKPNFLLCLLFLTYLKLIAYVTFVHFHGHKKQSQSNPIWGSGHFAQFPILMPLPSTYLFRLFIYVNLRTEVFNFMFLSLNCRQISAKVFAILLKSV